MKVPRVLLMGLLTLASCVAWMPATWLDRGVARMTHGDVRLVAASGSVWRGSGQLTRLAPDGGVTPVARITWRFQPGSLRAGQASWLLASGATNGSVTWGWSGWRMEGVESVLPGEVLQVFQR